MANCININIPSVRKALDELTEVFNNENIAYALLSKNNEHNLDLTPSGNESTLYEKLVQLGNTREQSLKEKAIVYTPKFLKQNNWLESGVEPSWVELQDFKDSFAQVQQPQKVEGIATGNTLHINDVQLDLRKIGINFPLTKDQVEVIQQAVSWIEGNGKNTLVISGNAGTGKTTITNVIIEYINKRKKRAVVSATTHKAVKVQKKMYGKRIEASTMHSALNITPNIKVEEFDMSNITFLTGMDLNHLRTDPIKLAEFSAGLKVGSGDIFIVDEASMVNDTLYDYIELLADFVGFKPLYIGDDKQFKPVKKNYISKVFREANNKSVLKLTSIMRQKGDNALLDVLEKFRTNQKTELNPLGKTRESTISKDGKEGLEWVTNPLFRDRIIELFKSNEYYNDSEYAKVIAYRNETVAAYNRLVRNLYGRTQEIEEGEILMAYDTVTSGSKYRPQGILNSADYKVLNKQEKVKTFVHPLDSSIHVDIQGVTVTLQDVLDPDSENVEMFIMSKNNSIDTKTTLARMLRETREQYYNLRRQKQFKYASTVYAMYGSLKNSFLTMEDLTIPGDFVKDKYKRDTSMLNVHKPKSVDYGYAITAHKSQGSTYQYALVDERDIDVIYKYDIESANQAKYVAFSRAAKGVISNTNGQITNTDGFNFETGDNFSEEVDLPDMSNQAVQAMIRDGIMNKICK